MARDQVRGTDWLRQRAAEAAKAKVVAPACNGEDAVDSQIERFLQAHGVRYGTKQQIPIDLIDEKSSLQNQARMEPIVPESVERFTASLKKGEYLPPIVVFPNGNRLTIVDGNNRFASHKKAGSRHVPGFIIDAATPSETIALLTVAANNGHGVTPDLKWRKRQALHLVSVGFTIDKACEAAGVTRSQYTEFKSLQQADARGKDMRVAGWLDLPETSRIALGKIGLDSVFYQAARLAIDTALDSDGCRALLRDTKALGSENDQVRHIAKLSDDRKAQARQRNATGGGRVSNAKQSLITGIGKVLNVDPAELTRTVLTDLDRQLIINKLNDLINKAGEIEAALVAGKVRDAG